MDSSKIKKGSRVRLKGIKGWWEVDSIERDWVTVKRTMDDRVEITSTTQDQIQSVSNKQPKGKK